jgi:hypothetical protein
MSAKEIAGLQPWCYFPKKDADAARAKADLLERKRCKNAFPDAMMSDPSKNSYMKSVKLVSAALIAVRNHRGKMVGHGTLKEFKLPPDKNSSNVTRN